MAEKLDGQMVQGKTMRLIYISAPFSAGNNWDFEANVRKAEQVAKVIADNGGVPVSRHSLFKRFSGTITGSFWINAAVEVMKKCDAVVLLPGWNDSPGASYENTVARENGLQVFTTMAEVREFIGNA